MNMKQLQKYSLCCFLCVIPFLMGVICFSYTSGIKDEIATRIAKKRLNPSTIQQNQEKIKKFLSPTLKTKPDDKPTVNAAYAKSFNLVDRLNRALSLISYIPKISSESMRLFIGVIEIAIVQTYFF